MSDRKVVLKFLVEEDEGGSIFPTLYVDSGFAEYLKLSGTIELYRKIVTRMIEKKSESSDENFSFKNDGIDSSDNTH